MPVPHHHKGSPHLDHPGHNHDGGTHHHNHRGTTINDHNNPEYIDHINDIYDHNIGAVTQHDIHGSHGNVFHHPGSTEACTNPACVALVTHGTKVDHSSN